MNAWRLAIVGSRHYPRPELVRAYVARLPLAAVSGLWSGGASGVDTWAAEAARTRGILVTELRPDWRGQGRRAGFVRNHAIVDAVHWVVAFWDGSSSGTAHTIQVARMAGKLRRTYGPDGSEIEWPSALRAPADSGG